MICDLEKNVNILIKDLICGPKFLGTILLNMLSNSNYEIIDGQHRFVACKKLGIPVTFKYPSDAKTLKFEKNCSSLICVTIATF